MAGSSVSNPATIIVKDAREPHLLDCIDSVMDSLPDNQIALRYQDPAGEVSEISYRELSKQTESLAAEMTRRGVCPGDRVGIYFLNSPEFVISYLAILKVGAVVVPINPLLKSAEINHILSDSNALHLVASGELLKDNSALAPVLKQLKNVFSVALRDSSGSDSAREEADNFRAIVIDNLPRASVKNLASEDGLAVLVYTSGTTGNPKGAMLGHDNLASAVAMKRDSFIVRADDRLLAVLPLCHIYGMVVVMLGTLSEGAALSLIESFDAGKVLDRIESDRITILPAVPAMFRFMDMEQEERNRDTTSLRYCVTGGAAMDPVLRVKAEQSLGAPILEGYALTEVSCVATLTRLDGVRKPGSAGPAIDGVQLKILDKDRKTLPPGSDNVGEVAIGGPQVMRGYYKQEEATRKVFHDSLFLTGDLGYLDEDGYLFIRGRTKELIIRGGQNIYPREIETAINDHPAVAEVAVVGIPDKYMGERVKAVIVPLKNQEDKLSESELKSFLEERLAPYKIPRIFEFRQSLPRNSTGKVLKRLLV